MEARRSGSTRLFAEDPEAAAANLERMAEEAGDLRARFDGRTASPGEEETTDADEEVPVRAVALLRLAQVRRDQGRPADALRALQRVLREEGAAEIRGILARDAARRMADEVLRVSGREVYAPYEKEARALLDAAERDGDARGSSACSSSTPTPPWCRRRCSAWGDGPSPRGGPSRRSRRSAVLLAEHGESPLAPAAGAALAEACDRAGLEGASRFAWEWLARAHPDAALDDGGRPTTGAALAAARRRPPRAPLPARRAGWRRRSARWPSRRSTTTPGAGRSSSPAGRRGSPGRPPDRRTDPHGLRPRARDGGVPARDRSLPPRGLGRRGPRARGRRGPRGPDRRRRGTALARDEEGAVLDLDGASGQVFALVQDPRAGRGNRQLLALDAVRGEELVAAGPLRGVRRARPGPARHRRAAARGALPARADLARAGGDRRARGKAEAVLIAPPEGRTEGEPRVVGDVVLVAARDETGRTTSPRHSLSHGGRAWTPAAPRERAGSAA